MWNSHQIISTWKNMWPSYGSTKKLSKILNKLNGIYSFGSASHYYQLAAYRISFFLTAADKTTTLPHWGITADFYLLILSFWHKSCRSCSPSIFYLTTRLSNHVLVYQTMYTSDCIYLRKMILIQELLMISFLISINYFHFLYAVYQKQPD